MEPLSLTDMSLRIGTALLCGALVGIERERKQRPAGFRTMILISIGSCGFVLLGHETIAAYAVLAAAHHVPGTPYPGQAEMSRVFQGLIGGIGFLGAGAVIQNKKAVRGLTTAAAVWVVAALGAACGMGFYALAIILGLTTLFTLFVLELIEIKYFPDPTDSPAWWKHADDIAREGGGNGGGNENSTDNDQPRQVLAKMGKVQPPSDS